MRMKKGTKSLKSLWEESVSSCMSQLLLSFPEERNILCFKGKFLNELGVTSMTKIFQCLKKTGKSLRIEVEDLGKNQETKVFLFSEEKPFLEWIFFLSGSKLKFIFFESLFEILHSSFKGSRIQVFFQ